MELVLSGGSPQTSKNNNVQAVPLFCSPQLTNTGLTDILKQAEVGGRGEYRKAWLLGWVSRRQFREPGQVFTAPPSPRNIAKKIGCLTCRKRKVKCDELKPVCAKCHRLQRNCVWSEDLQAIPRSRQQYGSMPYSSGSKPILLGPCGQSFVAEFPNVNRATVPYLHHFVTFCCRFLVYANDNEGNPLQEELIPLAVQSPALLHSMAAVAAGHLSRSQISQHDLTAAKHYSIALRELTVALSNPVLARSDAMLGACLLLCVYEVLHSIYVKCYDSRGIDITFGELSLAATSSGSKRSNSISGRAQDDGLSFEIFLPS